MYDFIKYTPRKPGVKPYKFLTFSFDDGVTQDRRFAQILNRYGIKCTFNLNSGYFGTPGRLETPEFSVDHSKVSADEVAGLYAGHETAVHSLTHPRLDMLDHEGVLRELTADKANIEAASGQSVMGMAYPGGPFYNDMVIKTAREEAGLVYARSTRSHYTFAMPENLMVWEPSCHIIDSRAEELARSFIELEPECDSLFYVWGHSYEFDIHDCWDAVESFCRLIAGHDDITYATNGEIAGYILNK